MINPTLTPRQEAEHLKNLLCDPDDWLSARVLETYYADQNQIVTRLNTSSPTNDEEEQ